MDGTAVLVKTTYIADSIGVPTPAESLREVFVSAGSIFEGEFHKAAQSGLKPRLQLKVSMFDYDGEEEVEYQGKRFRVYRSYLNQEEERVELYLEERVGICKSK